MRWHVIGAFRVVFEIIGIFRDQPIEEFLEITPCRRIRILHHDQAATGVLRKNRDDAIFNLTLPHHGFDFIGDLVSALACCRNGKVFSENAHAYLYRHPERRRGIPKSYLKAFATGPLGPSRTGMFARDDRSCGMQADLDRVLFDEATILRRLDELAMQISADYRDRELTVIAILNGSLMFMADLLRRIPLPLRLDCLSVASYHGGLQTSGEVIFRQVAQPDVAGRDILLLDDILDSGTTINAIREKLQTASPKSIRVCVLLRKIKERARPIEADYVGFDIADEFVVGYGLDYGEGYRNLPCIGVLKKELMA